MSALRWGRRTSAPPAPRIHVHTPKAPPNNPDRVAFLGDAEELETHFIRPGAREKGRSEPCPGVGCDLCLSGLPAVRNYYAPALLLIPDVRVHGREQWERVVFYIPQGAVAGFSGGVGRGKVFAVWRHLVGSVSQVRSRLLARVDLAEPAFDVRPVVEHILLPSSATASALNAIFNALPPLVTPPNLNPPKDTTPPATAEEIAKLKAAAMAKADPAKATGEPLEKYRASMARGKDVIPGTNGTHKPEGGAE